MQEGPSFGAADLAQTTQPPSCVAEHGSLCQQVYDLTGVDWLARYADNVVHATMTILTIIVGAVLLRLLLHRAINRLTSRVNEGRTPSWLRFRERGEGQRATTRTQSAMRRAQRARTIGSLLRSVSAFVIYGIAVMMVLAQFGVDIAPILASAGVLGLAIGFGAQNLVRDFLSGIFMMLEDQYGVGDTIDLGEARGEVETVGLRTTAIRDINGTVWYVRNGEILRVGNFSKGFAVAVVDVPLAHHADTNHAGELAERAALEVTDHEHAADVIEEPEVLGVQSVTPYAVTLRLTVKTRPGRQWAVQRTLNARVQAALTAAGIPSPAMAAVPAQAR